VYNKQVRWYIKPPFDGIFTHQYLYQNLLKLDNYCWNYRWWLGGILFLDTVYYAKYWGTYFFHMMHNFTRITNIKSTYMCTLPKTMSAIILQLLTVKMPSVLWHCWLGGRKSLRPVKKWGKDGGGGHWLVWMKWRPAGWSVCLPLLIFPCTIKSRSSLLAPAHPGGSRKKGRKTVVVTEKQYGTHIQHHSDNFQFQVVVKSALFSAAT